MHHMADPSGCLLLLMCQCSQHIALLQMGPHQQPELQATTKCIIDFLVRNASAACLAVQASMLEIYNEEYKDLLGKGPPAGKKHQVGDVALQVQADKHGLTWACNGSRPPWRLLHGRSAELPAHQPESGQHATGHAVL